MSQINSSWDLKTSQKKKSTEELKDKIQAVSQSAGQKIMKIKVKEKINPRHPISRYQGLQKEKKKERKRQVKRRK